ncbi:MAG TPA: hypothetical protein DET40_13115 [Lentisphaeria bacterium]|nr:MAG: hypothetical protein A2X45_17425 [Lentisphaerae bacterium GWF2_50_93]HCE44482.1 hypothetical protein [Lentisphaeria bacterium]
MKTKNNFTLVELIAAMGVFSLIMLMVMTMFLSVQTIWKKSSQESQVFENARIALDLMARDLQCAYYEVNKTPFWFKPDTSGIAAYKVAADIQYKNPALCFISDTLVPPNPYCESKMCEIKYQLYGTTYDIINANDGWLLRSATGDKKADGSDNLYNAAATPTGTLKFYNFYKVRVRGGTPAAQVFTLDTGSSDVWEQVIPYVTSMTFECNRRDGSAVAGYAPASTTTSYTPTKTLSPFPFSVRFTLTLLDSDSWNKWRAMAKAGTATAEPAAAVTFRQQRERKFSKTVLLGERGQAK